MGGHALSQATVRIPVSEYQNLVTSCVQQLAELYPTAQIEAIPAYASKQDFGDLDLLIGVDEGYDPTVAAEKLKATEVVRNGPVTSIGVQIASGELFQVDLIKMPLAHFDYALNYFSFNDLGNLCGRIAHKMGLKHGHDGLTYTLRDGTHQFGELVLTTDFDKALTFLGYSSERFHQGFNTLEEIFQFTVSTPFFNRDIFLLENRNHAARVRDRKRKTYMEFLAWIDTQPNLPAYPFPEDKKAWFAYFQEHFPDFRDEYEEACAAKERINLVGTKFNGEIVSQWTGLTGKALGQVMRSFKESFESVDAMRDFVLRTSLTDIEARVQQVQAEMAS